MRGIKISHNCVAYFSHILSQYVCYNFPSLLILLFTIAVDIKWSERALSSALLVVNKLLNNKQENKIFSGRNIIFWKGRCITSHQPAVLIMTIVELSLIIVNLFRTQNQICVVSNLSCVIISQVSGGTPYRKWYSRITSSLK